VTLTADLRDQTSTEGVDDRHTHAVQSTGHGVGLLVELATGVQHGEDDLERRAVLLRVQIDGDAAAVVDDADATVGREGHVDL
jgi:hypothetical protein